MLALRAPTPRPALERPESTRSSMWVPRQGSSSEQLQTRKRLGRGTAEHCVHGRRGQQREGQQAEQVEGQAEQDGMIPTKPRIGRPAAEGQRQVGEAHEEPQRCRAGPCAVPAQWRSVQEQHQVGCGTAEGCALQQMCQQHQSRRVCQPANTMRSCQRQCQLIRAPA